jgi:hypothetical protein
MVLGERGPEAEPGFAGVARVLQCGRERNNAAVARRDPMRIKRLGSTRGDRGSRNGTRRACAIRRGILAG